MKTPTLDNPIFDTVLSFLRTSLWGPERFPPHLPEHPNWNEVYEELRQQAVPHLCVDFLAQGNPEQNMLYTTNAAKNMMRFYRIMQEQQSVCHMFQDAGIPCAVVKGAAAALNYPQPFNRSMGDIDLLIHPEYFDSACKLLEQTAQFIGENFRHREYKRNKVVIELHRAFATFREDHKRNLFDQRIFGAISVAECSSIENFTFFRLPDIENGLILLMHIDVHLENGLGIRQIIDWMMYVDKHLNDEVWHADFAPFLRQLEREKLAVTVTRMCQIYLGLRTDITWCNGADEALCARLMNHIFSQGNFGRKRESGANRAAAVIQISVNLPAFFRVLQHRGLINWNAAKKYPILRPFAWLYQLLHYIVCGLKSGHPIQFLTHASREARSHSLLFSDLGVSHLAEEGKVK